MVYKDQFEYNAMVHFKYVRMFLWFIERTIMVLMYDGCYDFLNDKFESKLAYHICRLMQL